VTWSIPSISLGARAIYWRNYQTNKSKSNSIGFPHAFLSHVAHLIENRISATQAATCSPQRCGTRRQWKRIRALCTLGSCRPRRRVVALRVRTASYSCHITSRVDRILASCIYVTSSAASAANFYYDIRSHEIYGDNCKGCAVNVRR